jgi:hypothetical protein
MSFIVKSDSTTYCGIEIFCRGFVFLPYPKILENFSIHLVIKSLAFLNFQIPYQSISFSTDSKTFDKSDVT